MRFKAFQVIEQNIRQKKFAPIYFLCGEEPYFIERIAQLLEEYVLEGVEKSFNLDILYGSEINIKDLLALVRTYPTMAPYRLVIVKEAHNLKDFDKLGTYFDAPVPTTVLAFLYYKKLESTSKIGKIVSQAGKKNTGQGNSKEKVVVFESNPLYENEVEDWIEMLLQEKGIRITEEALALLLKSLGTNLQLIDSELNKLFIHLRQSPNPEITKEMVYDYIDIDRQFNVFELINLIGERRSAEAHEVLNAILRNPKENPPIMIVSQLFQYFSRLAILKQNRCETDKAISEVLKIKPYFASQYRRALVSYPYHRIQENLHYLMEADLALKGVNSDLGDDKHIMKVLVYKMLN
ncbi:MAG: DNA polymerase III subunit delta [Bacteroidia bacterium]|nr:DNA polymerase III subunit delta [Bacteroidia bacterium]MDW8159180.1 DNA polymerase III subunit delta [Bacteroidia bacterium]